MISKTQPGMIAVVAIMSLVTLFATWWIIGEGYLCKQEVFRKDPAPNKSVCFEFWLNRYQQLIAGILALGAAVIAAALVWFQLRKMDAQIESSEKARAIEQYAVALARAKELSRLATNAWSLQEVLDDILSLADSVKDLESQFRKWSSWIVASLHALHGGARPRGAPLLCLPARALA